MRGLNTTQCSIGKEETKAAPNCFESPSPVQGEGEGLAAQGQQGGPAPRSDGWLWG